MNGEGLPCAQCCGESGRVVVDASDNQIRSVAAELPQAEHGLSQRSDCAAVAVGRICRGRLNGCFSFHSQPQHQFLCAWYLVRYAEPQDATLLWDWIYLPDRPETEVYYYVWQFLCEMPDRAVRHKSWLTAIEPLYRPCFQRKYGSWDAKRSSEMIFRSWPQLDKLCASGITRAVQIRDRLWEEFEQILARDQGTARENLAREFTQDFLDLPGGSFRMGSPPEKQEVSDKDRRRLEQFLAEVPAELKQLMGDRDPFLSLADKVSSAATHRDPPFDGRCHGCREADAEYEASVTLTYLDEREVQHDGGITVAPGFLMVKSGATRETWREIVFPLQLCGKCQTRFEAERPGLIQQLFVNLAFGVFLAFAFLVLIVLAAVLHLGILVGVFVFVALLAYRLRKRGPEFLLAWLEPIPFAGDLVRAQDEYRLRLGKPHPFSRPEMSPPWPNEGTVIEGTVNEGDGDCRDAAIVVCPRCAVPVLPTRDGSCPSCRHVIADA